MITNNQGKTLYLSVLNNCRDEQRFNAWQASGGALLGNLNIGCGINALTYLEIFNRQQGEHLVQNIDKRGTTFDEMMNYVFNSTGGNKQYRIQYDVSTEVHVMYFITELTFLLCNNCCTIAKMLRYPENSEKPQFCKERQISSGHTIVFSKDNAGELWAIDPQQGTRRKSSNATKAFGAWQQNCYKYVHLMFSENFYHEPINITNAVPMQIDDADDDADLQSAMQIDDADPQSAMQIDDADDDADGQFPIPMIIDYSGGKTKKSKQSKKVRQSKKRRKQSKKRRKQSKKRRKHNEM